MPDPDVASAGEAVPHDTATRLVSGEPDVELRTLLVETLERNPALSSAEAEVAIAARRIERVGGLPDLTASLTAFLETPETRVGPQVFTAAVGQSIPWGSKRSLTSQAQALTVETLEAAIEAKRLKLVTEVRELYHELGFVMRHRTISEALRTHLLRHEEVARARYTTGQGAGQGVLKLQAEITGVDRRLLDLGRREAALEARLNGLRDRPADTRIRISAAEVEMASVPGQERLLQRALVNRPELRGLASRSARAEAEIGLAQARSKPDFRVGLVYTMVDERQDMPGKMQPPVDNGKDIFGIQGGISIPLWRRQRTAGVEEAVAAQSSVEVDRASLITEIDAQLADLTVRLDLTWKEIRLLEDLLVVQTEEALESAQAAYVAGTLSALELFDAEHMLFEAETAVARAAADYQIALARLEGTVGEPIERVPQEEAS
jgi:outer membrane protein TolC